MRSPTLNGCNTRLHVNLVSINMINTVMVLMIKQNSTNIRVILLHPKFEGLNLKWGLNIDDMLVRILMSKLISKGVGMIGHRLPILS